MNLRETHIKQLFGGRLVGSETMKRLVVGVVAKLPEEMAHYVGHHCWFLSSTADAWAYTFNGSDVVDKHFIFLSDELLQQPKSAIEFTISHEIGHVILRHRNSISSKQSRQEIDRQEMEADAFAEKYR